MQRCQASIARRGREADLIVHNDVQRAAGRVAFKVGKVQRLGDDALAREGSVAVDQQRDALTARRVAVSALLRARAAFDDGVNRFQMTGIWCQGQVYRLARCRWHVAGKAEMVLHVTVAID